MGQFSLGLDFGTLSARILLLDVNSGKEIQSVIFMYPKGEISDTLEGVSLSHGFVLQDPNDYIAVIEEGLVPFIQNLPVDPLEIVGLGVSFTSCTMLPIKADGTPLCNVKNFKNRPHAYVKLWKQHTAMEEANKITEVMRKMKPELLERFGGSISAQWMLPKIYEILKQDPVIFEETDYFVEACDFVNHYLTEVLATSKCFAGFKNLYIDEYPSSEIMKEIDPRLEFLYEKKIITNVVEMGSSLGKLCIPLQEKTGMKNCKVASGIIDAHANMLTVQSSKKNKFVLILGTSSCQIILSDSLKKVPGICGVIQDGVIPGYYAYEAGQPAVGDMFQWLFEEMLPYRIIQEAKAKAKLIYDVVEESIANYRPGQHGLLALDWWNGNRSPINDLSLRGIITGLNLTTTFEDIYHCMIESTAYGAKKIIDVFEQNGIVIDEVIACGGIAFKNSLLLQIYADIIGKPILVSDSSLTGCYGSAVLASVAAGCYSDMDEALGQLGKSKMMRHLPRNDYQIIYEQLYASYSTLFDVMVAQQKNILQKECD